MKTNPNDSIQPQKYSETKGNMVYHKETTGLTKREHFASMFMQGLIASWGSHDLTDKEELAHDAVRFADALIQELNETSTEN